VILVDFGGIVDYHSIPPISTKITSHLNSLSDGQQFWLILVELLTITQ
jgi:hypothetical protein